MYDCSELLVVAWLWDLPTPASVQTGMLVTSSSMDVRSLQMAHAGSQGQAFMTGFESLEGLAK